MHFCHKASIYTPNSLPFKALRAARKFTEMFEHKKNTQEA
jgi:hypothetical protein